MITASAEIFAVGAHITVTGGAVLSVFGRVGSVSASFGDYSFSLIAGTLSAAQEPATTVNAVVSGTNVTGSISAQTLTLGWTGQLSVANGGTGTATPSLIGGTGISISGSWPDQTITATGVTGVSSVFGRTGAVVAMTGDYSFSQISGSITAAQEPATTVNSVVNDTNVTGSIAAQVLTLGWTGTLSVARGGTGTATPSLIGGTDITISGSWPNQTISVTSAVDSVFGRTGVVTAQTGDYTVAQVTGAAPIASPTFTGTATAPVFNATNPFFAFQINSENAVSSDGTSTYITPIGAGGSVYLQNFGHTLELQFADSGAVVAPATVTALHFNATNNTAYEISGEPVLTSDGTSTYVVANEAGGAVFLINFGGTAFIEFANSGATTFPGPITAAGTIAANLTGQGYVGLIPNSGVNLIESGTFNNAAAQALYIAGPGEVVLPAITLNATAINMPGTLFLGTIAQLESPGGATISGVAGTLFGIANSGVAWVLSLDTSGDLGLLGRVAAASFQIGTGPTWTAGSGAPSGAPAGGTGSLYSNTSGAIGSSFYVWNGTAWYAAA